MAMQTDAPFLGRPVLSNQRCPTCGARLLGFPYWHTEPEGGGWIGFSVECDYRCPTEPSRTTRRVGTADRFRTGRGSG
jgi:hypothetical protein